MPNDISGINSGRSQQAGEKQTSSVRSDGKNSTSRMQSLQQGVNDKVSLTDMAARMKALEQKLAEQPDVEEARVDRVRNALARGEYQINPERIADKMINFESDM